MAVCHVEHLTVGSTPVTDLGPRILWIPPKIRRFGDGGHVYRAWRLPQSSKYRFAISRMVCSFTQQTSVI
jgi:hypothetical protein